MWRVLQRAQAQVAIELIRISLYQTAPCGGWLSLVISFVTVPEVVSFGVSLGIGLEKVDPKSEEEMADQLEVALNSFVLIKLLLHMCVDQMKLCEKISEENSMAQKHEEGIHGSHVDSLHEVSEQYQEQSIGR